MLYQFSINHLDLAIISYVLSPKRRGLVDHKASSISNSLTDDAAYT